MKIKINSLKAFTLLEVLVASAVISIILLGVVTASLSLHNTARYAAASYFVTQSTQTTLNYILNAASMAVGSPGNPGFIGIDELTDLDSSGDAVEDDAGVVIDLDSIASGDPEDKTFCIHQNLKVDGTYDPANPAANHRWVCYTYDVPSSYQISSCIKPFDVNNLPGSSGYKASVACSSPEVSPCKPAACAQTDLSFRVLGKSKVKPVTTLSINGGAVSGTQKAIFTVQIENCLDPGGLNCEAGDSNNPYVVKTGSVGLPGHSS